MENITEKQRLRIKSSVVNAKNYLNGIFSSFDSLNSEFSPDSRLVNNFSSHFFFYQANHKDNESKAAYLCKLDEIFSDASLDPKSVIVISNGSIKKNVATSISYAYCYPNEIKKTIHHTVNIISIKAELFAIRCEINQAIYISVNQTIHIPDAFHIIIITSAIHSALHIFDSTIHSYQQQSIIIAKNLRNFFLKHSENSIEF